MTEVLVKFDEPISDRVGALYFAQAVGLQREDGLWEGWLEFTPVSESGPPAKVRATPDCLPYGVLRCANSHAQNFGEP